MFKTQLIKSKKQWYFRIVSRNGNIICHSEMYKRKSSALKTIRNMVKYFQGTTDIKIEEKN